jgi:hypothetical protein
MRINSSNWLIETGVTVIDGSHSVYKTLENWEHVLQEAFGSFLRLMDNKPIEDKDVSQALIGCIGCNGAMSDVKVLQY